MTNANITENSSHRGRTAIISDENFIAAHCASESIDDVINAFPALQSMQPAKARLYVSMRAASLRKNSPSLGLKTFQRGRKSASSKMANIKKPIMVEPPVGVSPALQNTEEFDILNTPAEYSQDHLSVPTKGPSTRERMIFAENHTAKELNDLLKDNTPIME